MSKLTSIVQHRRGTTSEWSVIDLIPKAGEIVIEECEDGNRKIKIGDGENPFSRLPYATGSAGGGGTGNTHGLNISYITPDNGEVTTTAQKDIELTFNYSGYDSSGDKINRVTGYWYLVTLAGESRLIAQQNNITFGINHFLISKYLPVGYSTVYLIVEAPNGMRSEVGKYWTIDRKELTLEVFLDDTISYPIGEPINASFIAKGTVEKVFNFEIDGESYFLDGNDNSNLKPDGLGDIVPFTIPGKPYGIYPLKMYLIGIIDPNKPELDLKTEPIIKNVIFFDTTDQSKTPLISSISDELEVSEYSVKDINYTVYDPKNSIPNVDIFIQKGETGKDDTTITQVVFSRPLTNNTDTYSFVADKPGTYYIIIKCRTSEKKLKVVVTEAGEGAEPITTGLTFDFNPVGKNNADIINKESNLVAWTDSKNSEIFMTVSENFDWVNGGYITDDKDGPCFLIKAGSTATLNYELFSKESTKDNGKEIKIKFKTMNVSDPNSEFLTCLHENIGIKMTPQKANIYADNGGLEVFYSEEDAIELDFNILGKNTASGTGLSQIPMIMGYEDGVPTKPFVCTNSSSFMQNNPQKITLGSDNCDVYLYRFKTYERALTNREILNNFSADAITTEEKVSRYTRNNINLSGSVTEETIKAFAEQFPDLRIILLEAPKFTSSKKENIANTTITQIYKGGRPEDNWTAYDAVHSGQGTSSDKYGLAGRNIDLKVRIVREKDANGKKVAINTDPRFSYTDAQGIKHDNVSKVSLTKDSIPVDYFNIKVNIASSNNITNALIAKHYNEFNPYKRPLYRYSEVSLKDKYSDEDIADMSDTDKVKNLEAIHTEYISDLKTKLKDTMEFHNCVVFIKETDTELDATGKYKNHREFNDTDWHFYAIGNIGDSKKTDDTRLTDIDDPYECCLELLDVKLSLSDFPVDTKINAMAQRENETTKELEYVWVKEENRDILFESEFTPTEDTKVNPNKIYYMDLPVIEPATPEQCTLENIASLFEKVFILTEDNKVNQDKNYYKDNSGLSSAMLSDEELKKVINPKEENLYEWNGNYIKTLDTTILDKKPYFVEVLKKLNAMDFVYIDKKRYLTATDEMLKAGKLFIKSDQNGYIQVPVDATLNVDENVYYTREAETLNGEFIGWKYNNAMGYVYDKIKEYIYAKDENLGILYEFIDGEYKKSADSKINSEKTYYINNNGTMEVASDEYLKDENLCKLYQISYFQTNEPIDYSKTYYVDILEHEDFSKDYNYEWRYISDDENSTIVNACHKAWIDFYRFVTTSTKEEFKNKLQNYFNVDSALYYYLFTTRYCMVDNRAKNTFWHYGKSGNYHKVENPCEELLDTYYKKEINDTYTSAKGTVFDPNITYYSQHVFDLCWDYDNDTSLGLNNYGEQTYRYGLEDTDVDNTGIEVFREMDSTFFCKIRDCFEEELAALYRTLDGDNAWDAESFISECDKWQAEFPEELWRLDIERKYIRPYKDDPQFLINMCNGRMKYHRRYWERNQERYMASKYKAQKATANNNVVRFRFQTSGKTNPVVKENYQLTLTPCSYVYLTVQYGSSTPSSVRVTDENINTPVTVPFYGVSTDLVDVHSASALASLGDLSACYPSTASFKPAKRIRELILGNHTKGYDNALFDAFDPSSNPLLELIDITNISGLKSELELEDLINLKTLKAFGTNIPGVLFAQGGKIEEVELPRVQTIKLKKLNNLTTENLKVESYDNIKDLMILDCPSIDSILLFEQCINPQRVSLDGLVFGTKENPIVYTKNDIDEDNLTESDWNDVHKVGLKNYLEHNFINRVERVRTESGELIEKVINNEKQYYRVKGINPNTDNTTEFAYLEGTCYFETITAEEYSELKAIFPELKISFNKLETKIIFKDINGVTELETIPITATNSEPYSEYLGNTPVATGLVDSAKYKYKHNGWTTKKYTIPSSDSPEYVEFEAPEKEDDALKNILEVRVVYPAFKNEIRSYDVTFYNPINNGEDVKIEVVSTEYGKDAVCLEKPIKLGVSNADNYEFIGWLPEPLKITGPVSCYARFKVKDEVWHDFNLNDLEETNGYIASDGKITLVKAKANIPSIIQIPEIMHIKGTAYTVTAIAWGCFETIRTLEHIKLPDTITKIDGYAFGSCSYLSSVELPKNLTFIGQNAFAQCNNLESIDIPATVSKIDPYAFAKCPLLSTINISPSNVNYSMIHNGEWLLEKNTNKLHTCLLTINDLNPTLPSDDTIKIIGTGAFNSSPIIGITLSDKVEEIEGYAFQNCNNLTEISIPDGCILGATAFGWCPKLSTVKLPNDIKDITTYVFDGCAIETIEIPKSVTNLGDHAFGNNKNLRKVTFNTSAPSTSDEKWITIDYRAFADSGHQDGLVINVPWSKGDVKDAPWSAINCTVNYNYDTSNE